MSRAGRSSDRLGRQSAKRLKDGKARWVELSGGQRAIVTWVKRRLRTCAKWADWIRSLNWVRQARRAFR